MYCLDVFNISVFKLNVNKNENCFQNKREINNRKFKIIRCTKSIIWLKIIIEYWFVKEYKVEI